ncbi:MAG: hypothetical protein AAF065_09415 [Verrucomicrobiota bacterium]
MITILRFILFFLVAPAFAIVAQAAGSLQDDFRILDVDFQAELVALDLTDGEICNYDSSGALLHQRKSLDGEDRLIEFEELKTSGAERPLFLFLAELVATNKLVDTNTIRFTQDSISSRFRDGRSVQGLIDDLGSGRVSPNDLPPIRTFQQDGLTFTLDNRRLFAADQAGVPIRTVPATAAEVAKELPKKFTTPNQGTIIGIRGKLE